MQIDPIQKARLGRVNALKSRRLNRGVRSEAGDVRRSPELKSSQITALFDNTVLYFTHRPCRPLLQTA